MNLVFELWERCERRWTACRSPRKRNGKWHRLTRRVFSLIELLVVIAIISILMSILLPALKNTRERVKSLNCLNNEKQLNVGFINYIQDFSDYYPTKPTVSEWFTCWDAKLAEYFGLDGTQFGDNAKVDTVYRCPSMKIEYSYSGRSYVANNNLGDASQAIHDKDILKQTQVSYPSKLGLLFETPNCSGSFFGKKTRNMFLENDAINNKQEFRHKNGENILFFDGHAEWQPYRWVDSMGWRSLYDRSKID